MIISIIVPTLNEEAHIENTVSNLQYLREKGHEIILVDGGSKDSTHEIAEKLVDKIFISNPGRAKQMNLGALNATGDVLLFLHADTILPENVDSIIIDIIDNDLVWGCFTLHLSGGRFIYRVLEYFINLRSKYSGIATGDQGIFITKKLFKLVKGYPDFPLMEDIAISQLLKPISKPVYLSNHLVSSSRRWEEKGVFKTIILMWKLRLQYWLGVAPDKLAKMYE
ncbi:MAG: rSAM/selenodomain-associated transferase 2 [Gammaproteobacteria bacterium]|jgi:rSAM/selenodomain-associated transferase 2